MDPQHAFNIATVFDLALSFVIGLLSARLATALVWPQRPGARVTALDQRLRSRLLDQVSRVQQWLGRGGAPPPPLASAELLPMVLDLQQPPSRQLGLLWRLIVRHWLLLEPQLLGLTAPLGHPAGQQLLQRLGRIGAGLTPAAEAEAADRSPPAPPIDWCGDLTSQLIALAIEQQLNTLDQLLHSQRLLRSSGRLQRQVS